MANIKSAKKRILITAKKTMRNKMIRSKVKNSIKKLYTVLNENNKDLAKEALKNATKVIDKACSKGVFHKKTASRRISRLTKLVNKA